jgi:AcrR family transcriptional regulator
VIRTDITSVIDSISTNATPVNRAERRKLQTRAAIKAAAFQLLMERGFQAVSIKAITDLADIGYGTFYLHFPDKDAAIWEVLYEWMEADRRRTEEHTLHLPYPLREYMGLLAVFEAVGQTRAQFAEMFGRNGSITLNRNLYDYMASIYHFNLANQVYQSGLDVPAPFLAQYSVGGLIQLLIWWAETPNDYTPQQMTDMLFVSLYRQAPPRPPLSTTPS